MAKQPPRSGSQSNGATRPGRQRRTRSAVEPTGPDSAPAQAPASADDARSTSMASEPSEDDIRLRAYHRFLERGGAHGFDFEDWLEAERELRGKR
jgi:hypothetical protein